MLSKNSEIYSTLSKKYGIHKSVISMICNHPFIFASRRISDPNDEKSIMFAYLFKIRLKKRFRTHKKEINDKVKEKKLLREQSRIGI